ncbi:MAG TPA: aspartate/glutamate racemase family protein [Marmoricola sp.]
MSNPVTILVVNVNTTEEMTRSIAALAQQAASPDTTVVGLTPTFGAESCEGNLESYLAALGVVDAVQRYEGSYDAVVQAGFGEHGREALQEVLDVPVVDITEAAAHLAMMLGHRFSVVTTLDRTVPLIHDRLLVAGLTTQCASIRASGVGVLDLEGDSPRVTEAIVQEAKRAVLEDHAEVICLGCGGMAGLDTAVREAVGVPVVDGVTAAVRIAEGLVGLGLTTSKVRTYAPPRPKKIVGWPLPPLT